MSEVKHNDKTSMTKSQMKRVARKESAKKMKRNARLTKILVYCATILVSIGIISLIGYSIYRNITKVKPSSDYSAYLTTDGLIKDVNAADYIKLADYSNIAVPLSDVEYTDESVNKDIQTLLEKYSTLVKESTEKIKDGDKVNIDYVGTIDGKEFEGGNSNGAGSDLVIGSGSFVDDFEKQLIGHVAGDKVTVNVTFPADYSSKDVAGKDAVFEVVINGLYVAPEFTDEFVQKNLSDKATTVDGYKEYVKQSNYDSNLTNWIEKYLMDKTTVSSYPKEYVNHLKSIKKYEDQSSYEYMNQLYTNAGYGSIPTFEKYVGMSEAKYDASLEATVQDQAKKAMIYQAIFEKEGMTVTEDEYNTYIDDNTADGGTSPEEQYGKGYVMQEIITAKVLELVKGNATVK